MAKRYILYVSDAELGEEGLQELGRVLEKRHGRLKLIQVPGNGRALIVKTNAQVVSDMRQASALIRLSGKEVTAVLTSGGIGKLKKRAALRGASQNGEVSER